MTAPSDGSEAGFELCEVCRTPLDEHATGCSTCYAPYSCRTACLNCGFTSRHLCKVCPSCGKLIAANTLLYNHWVVALFLAVLFATIYFGSQLLTDDAATIRRIEWIVGTGVVFGVIQVIRLWRLNVTSQRHNREYKEMLASLRAEMRESAEKVSG